MLAHEWEKYNERNAAWRRGNGLCQTQTSDEPNEIVFQYWNDMKKWSGTDKERNIVEKVSQTHTNGEPNEVSEHVIQY